MKQTLEWFRAEDDSALRAPPDRPANRMNAARIRAFYGALQKNIAVAEAKPSIGGHVVVAPFTPIRELKVLDLGALGDVFNYIDLFDPVFGEVLERVTFLEMLEQEVSLPVQAADDPVGHVPTQVIADYVHTVLGLDGLAYRSTQTGVAPSWGQLSGGRQRAQQRNLVLFGAAARTISEGSSEDLEPGLQCLLDAREVVDVTRIKVSFRSNLHASQSHP